jgi:hypothetical protein
MVAAMKRLRGAILPILLVATAGSPLACRETEPQSPGETPPPPASTGAATGSGSSGSDETGAPVACGCLSEDQGSDECPCPEGQACAADHALGDPEPQAFTCRPDCIPEGEALLWCFHVPNAPDQALGCCTGVCRPDGLCGAPIEPTTGPSDDSTDSTDSTTDTGTSSSSSTTDSSTTDSSTSSSSSTGSSSTTAG